MVLGQDPGRQDEGLLVWKIFAYFLMRRSKKKDDYADGLSEYTVGVFYNHSPERCFSSGMTNN